MARNVLSLSPMGVIDVLRGELGAGLQRLRGGQVVVDLPLRQGVIDEVLRFAPGVPADLAIDIGPDRRLQIRYGVFRANARLHPMVVLAPTPVLVIELASQMVAWGLRRAPLPRFVRVEGRHVEVHLAAVPALRDLAPLWRHLRQVAFDSQPGRLDVRVTIDIAQEA